MLLRLCFQHHLVGETARLWQDGHFESLSDTYVIASYVASAAGRMGLMAGNRLCETSPVLSRPRRPLSTSWHANLDRAIVITSAIESGHARPATDLCNLQLPAAPCWEG